MSSWLLCMRHGAEDRSRLQISQLSAQALRQASIDDCQNRQVNCQKQQQTAAAEGSTRRQVSSLQKGSIKKQSQHPQKAAETTAAKAGQQQQKGSMILQVFITHLLHSNKTQISTLDMRPVVAVPSCFTSSSILVSRGFRSSSTQVWGAAHAAALQMREASLVTEARVEVATKRASCLMACSCRSLGRRANSNSIIGLHEVQLMGCRTNAAGPWLGV